ncbi:hypothetical protein [Lacipirellula sp.]|uniref:hypothetical protein n=1 Tax=Lacipirellula sp. TaxID=2691419 RepID=UPI003D0C1BC8
MTLCPLCRAGTKIQSPAWRRSFNCGTHIYATGRSQSAPCRIRQLELLLGEVLPLARGASCVHASTPSVVCCEWARIVDQLESVLTVVN